MGEVRYTTEKIEMNFTGVEVFRDSPTFHRDVSSKNKKRGFIWKPELTDTIHKLEKFLQHALCLNSWHGNCHWEMRLGVGVRLSETLI